MEEQIIYFIQGFRTPFLDFLVPVISNSYLVVIPLLIVYLFHRRNKNTYLILISLFLTLLTVMVLKALIPESRPCNELHIYFQECHNPTQSFPSGHTAIVFSPLTFLLFEMPLFILYLLYASLIGLTRIYLGLHYPHDVLAGALIGIVIGFVCLKNRKFLSYFIFSRIKIINTKKWN